MIKKNTYVLVLSVFKLLGYASVLAMIEHKNNIFLLIFSILVCAWKVAKRLRQGGSTGPEVDFLQKIKFGFVI